MRRKSSTADLLRCGIDRSRVFWLFSVWASILSRMSRRSWVPMLRVMVSGISGRGLVAPSSPKPTSTCHLVPSLKVMRFIT